MAGPLGNLVPNAGLEPPRVAPHAPQTCASANSATSAPAKGEYARPPLILSIGGREVQPAVKGSSAETNDASNSGLAKPWIEGVPDTLAHEIVGENRDENGQAGVEGQPPGVGDQILAVIEDIAPRRVGRLHSQAEKGQPGLGQDSRGNP